VRFSHDSRYVVAVSEGGQLAVWDLQTGYKVNELTFMSGTLSIAIAISAKLDQLAIGSIDGRVSFFSINPFKFVTSASTRT
jgi:WD40 repeat protein